MLLNSNDFQNNTVFQEKRLVFGHQIEKKLKFSGCQNLKNLPAGKTWNMYHPWIYVIVFFKLWIMWGAEENGLFGREVDSRLTVLASGVLLAGSVSADSVAAATNPCPRCDNQHALGATSLRPRLSVGPTRHSGALRPWSHSQQWCAAALVPLATVTHFTDPSFLRADRLSSKIEPNQNLATNRCLVQL